MQQEKTPSFEEAMFLDIVRSIRKDKKEQESKSGKGKKSSSKSNEPKKK